MPFEDTDTETRVAKSGWMMVIGTRVVVARLFSPKRWWTLNTMNEASSKLCQKKNMLEFVGEMYVRYQKKEKKSPKRRNKDRKRKL